MGKHRASDSHAWFEDLARILRAHRSLRPLRNIASGQYVGRSTIDLEGNTPGSPHLPSGAALFESVIAGSLNNIAELLIERYWAQIAQGEFEWLKEAQDMDFSTTSILSTLQGRGPWLTGHEASPEGDDPGELDPNLHQDLCAHVGGPPIDLFGDLVASKPNVNWQSRALCRDESMRVISAYCGLAGVIPDWTTGTMFLGRVTFQGSSACVSFSDSENQMQEELTSSKAASEQAALGSRSNQEIPMEKGEFLPLAEEAERQKEEVRVRRSKPNPNF